MTSNFIYIDDASEETIASLVDAVVGDRESVGIEYVPVREFEDLMSTINAAAKRDCGFILDWRLDQLANIDGKTATYKAAALAQEMRSRGAEGVIPERPIILWSTDDKLQNSFFADHTSHDLFDLVHHKDQLVDDAGRVRLELVEAFSAYVLAAKTRSASVEEALATSESVLSRCDVRFIDTAIRARSGSIHDWLRFVFKQVVRVRGVLVDEELLAATLGVDSQRSDDWNPLLDLLPDDSRYRGPFSRAWKRWWGRQIIQGWWKVVSSGAGSLLSLTAQERCRILVEFTGLQNLVPSEPILPTYSARFSTICLATSCPLDVVDGVQVIGHELQPWQDREYVCLDAALRGTYKDKSLRLHPSEIARVKELRSQ